MKLIICVVVIAAVLWIIWECFFEKNASSANLGIPTAGQMANPVPGRWWR